MALIPKPIDKLITIALKLPKVLQFVKSAGTRTKSGDLGLLVAVATPIVSKKIADVQEYVKGEAEKLRVAAQARVNDLKTKSAEELGMTEEEAEYALGVAEEALRRIEQTMETGYPFTEEEVMSMIEEEIEQRVKPPILAALAPPTALIGVPLFLEELITFLEAADPFMSAGIEAPQVYLSDMKPEMDVDPSLKVDTSDADIPKYAEWGSPPDEKSPIKKKNAQGKKVKWWWTVPPQLPAELGEGDWTRQQFGGLGSKDAHKRFMKRRYDQ